MPEMHSNLATRWFEEVWNKRRREAIAEMLAPNAPIHDGGATVYGPEGFYSFFDRMQAAFSDLHVTIHETIAEGDKICVRWTCTMKHTGDGLGMPPANKVLEATGITIVRVTGDKLSEGWQNWDMLGLLEQIRETGRSATYLGAG